MEVYRYGDKVHHKDTTMLLGAFESFHIGHFQLLKKARELEKPIGIMIFDDYTKLHSNRKYEFSTLRINLENLASLNIDFAIVITFDQRFRDTSAKDFVDTLVQKCNVLNFVCGQDFQLGRNREWTSFNLKFYFSNTHIIPIYKENNVKLATSRLLDNLQLGVISTTNELLACKFRITIRNTQDHLEPSPRQFLPHSGVYFGEIIFEDIAYPSLIKISMNYKITYSSIFKIPFEHNDFASIVFYDKKRLITKRMEDTVVVQEIESLKNYFDSFDKNQRKTNNF